MMTRVTIVVAGACLLLLISGCSVGMALSGKKEPNLGMVRTGSTRGEVELQLGNPVSSVTHGDGKRTDIYEYELGNEPSTGRAIGHGVMDVLTLGLWEVVGTPIEGFTGSKHRITIVYGLDDRVISVNQAVVPSPAPEQAQKGEPAIAAEAVPTGPAKETDAKTTTGTCFVASPDGVLLTAYHNVRGAKTIQVHLPDGTVTEAKIQTFNSGNDLAVLRIDLHTAYFLPLAQGGSVQVGDLVFTMGYPLADILGQEAKFTDGSVSALSGPGGEGGLLQMSVPVQPGNSGGPLVNERGEAVGIVTSTAAVQTFFAVTGTLPQNLNWAVKAEYARPMFKTPTVKSLAENREQAIEWTRRAICMVAASSS